MLFSDSYLDILAHDICVDILTNGDIDPNLYGYTNGIYDISTDTFWRNDYTKYQTEQYAAEIQQYRRKNGWGCDYTVKKPDKLPIQHFQQTFRFEEISPYSEHY
jgi:hypothetical protein